MKHKLEHLYDTYKKAQPEPFPISDNELRSMVDNGFQAKQQSQLTIRKGKIIMATTSSLIIFILSTLFFVNMDTAPTQTTSDSDIATESLQSLLPAIAQAKSQSPEPQANGNKENASIGRPGQSGIVQIVVDSFASNPLHIKPIMLNKDNAACFGIELKDSCLNIKYETGYTSMLLEDKKTEYYSKHYPENGIAHVSKSINFTSGRNGYFKTKQKNEIDEYTGWSMNQYNSLVPVGMKLLFNSKDNGSGTSSEELCMPKGIEDTLVLYLSLSSMGYHKDILDYNRAASISKCIAEGREFEFVVDRNKNSFIENAIPVLYQKILDTDTATVLLWFADLTGGKDFQCKRMLRSLGYDKQIDANVTYDADFMKYYSQIREVFEKMKNEYQTPYKPEYAKFTGINMLELTDEELEKLCVYKSDSGYNFESNEFSEKLTDHLRQGGYNTISDSIYFRIYYSITKNNVKNTSDLVKYRGWDLTKADSSLPGYVWLERIRFNWDPYRKAYEHAPSFMFHSIHHFKMNEKFPMDMSKSMAEAFSNYIPVHIRIGSNQETDSSKIDYTDAIVWFRCSPLLLEKLPERYRDRLTQELAVIDRIEKGDINADNACSLLPEQKSYFGLCGRVSGAVRNPEVSPMPVQTTAECKFLLLEDRQVKFSLYQASGNLVKKLTDFRQYTSGMRSESIDLGDVQAGVYFLTLESDKGEMVYTKIVVGQ